MKITSKFRQRHELSPRRDGFAISLLDCPLLALQNRLQAMEIISKCREGYEFLPGIDKFAVGLPDCPISAPQNHIEKRVESDHKR